MERPRILITYILLVLMTLPILYTSAVFAQEIKEIYVNLFTRARYFVGEEAEIYAYVYTFVETAEGNETQPIKDALVELYINGFKVAEGQTDEYGEVIFKYVFNEPGVYEAYAIARYGGLEAESLSKIFRVNPTSFNFKDPELDDIGAGTIKYPTGGDFSPGAFDLTGFEIEVNATNRVLILRAYFRNLGGNPWNSPNGWSLQYVHIYIKTYGTVSYETFGLNTWIYGGWNYAILLAPGWEDRPVPEGQVSAMYRVGHGGEITLVADEVKNNEQFDAVAVPEKNAIEVKVSFDLFDYGEIEVRFIDEWVITVAVAGYDGFEPQKVRPVIVVEQTWRFGGGDPVAVNLTIQPYVIDLLSRTFDDQRDMLNSYNVDETTLAIIRGIYVGNGSLIEPPPVGWTPPGFVPKHFIGIETEPKKTEFLVGENVTLIITVKKGVSPLKFVNVTLLIGNQSFPLLTDENGVAKHTLTFNQPGEYEVLAIYSAYGLNFTASTKLTIKAPPTETTPTETTPAPESATPTPSPSPTPTPPPTGVPGTVIAVVIIVILIVIAIVAWFMRGKK